MYIHTQYGCAIVYLTVPERKNRESNTGSNEDDERE